MSKITLTFDCESVLSNITELLANVAKKEDTKHYLVMCDYDEQTWVCGKVYHNAQEAVEFAKQLDIDCGDYSDNYHHYIEIVDENGIHYKREISQFNGADWDIYL